MSGFWAVPRNSGCSGFMARTLYSIAYQYYKKRCGIEQFLDKDVTLKVIDRFLEPGQGNDPGLAFRLRARLGRSRLLRHRSNGATPLKDLVRRETEALILGDDGLLALAKAGVPRGADLEPGWFSFVNRASNRIAAHFARTLLDQVSGANVFDICSSLGAARALYTMARIFSPMRRKVPVPGTLRRFAVNWPDG